MKEQGECIRAMDFGLSSVASKLLGRRSVEPD